MYNYSGTAPSLESIPDAKFALAGEIGRRLSACTHQWVLPAVHANPAILEMFRDRNRKPYRDMVHWAGEFAGKYLTHATQILRLTGDEKLKEHLFWFVGEMASLQDLDGYLGPWPDESKLTGKAPNCPTNLGGGTWDAWGHYHAMLGLLLWHEHTGDGRAMACATRIADLFTNKFLGSKPMTLHDTGSQEMNQAPIHSLMLLYRHTKEQRYLDLTLQIVEEFAKPPAGDYFRAGLANTDFWKTPKPRWESLHPIMGLAELHFETPGQLGVDYGHAFENLWWSMLQGDRHNNGGFTSGEQATGDPLHPGAIETCCTIAWMAMSIDMLRMTGSSIVADEIELSLLNSGIGMMSPSGRWVTYNTPMAGRKEASAHTIVFQARAGSPELNCCSVNGPRALGMIAEWAVMNRNDAIVLSYFGECSITAKTSTRNNITLAQQTDYPRQGRVNLVVAPERTEEFTLAIRIPQWSKKTKVTINGKPVEGIEPGTYLELTRRWGMADRVIIDLDLSIHFWTGKPVDGDVHKASIYRGPLLLAFDPRFDKRELADLPTLDASTFDLELAACNSWIPPLLLLEAKDIHGQPVKLCDFGSAGGAGNEYETWLPLKTTKTSPEFSRKNTMRTVRI